MFIPIGLRNAQGAASLSSLCARCRRWVICPIYKRLNAWLFGRRLGDEQSGRWPALEPFLTLPYRGPVGDEGLDPQCGLHR